MDHTNAASSPPRKTGSGVGFAVIAIAVPLAIWLAGVYLARGTELRQCGTESLRNAAQLFVMIERCEESFFPGFGFGDVTAWVAMGAPKPELASALLAHKQNGPGGAQVSDGEDWHPTDPPFKNATTYERREGLAGDINTRWTAAVREDGRRAVVMSIQNHKGRQRLLPAFIALGSGL